MILTHHGINALELHTDPHHYSSVTINGKTYKTLVMGNYEVMVENLADDNFGGVWYKQDESTYGDVGKLYTWKEASVISVDGWHCPTYAEWAEIKESDYNGIGLKSVEMWADHPGTNSTGFNALPSGYGYHYKAQDSWYFSSRNYSTGFWVSDKQSGTYHYQIVNLTSSSDNSYFGGIPDSYVEDNQESYYSVRLARAV